MRPSRIALPVRVSALLLLAAGCTAATEGTAPVPERRLSPTELRADFDALYDGLKAAHYDLYARRDRVDYDARFAAMRAGFDQPLSSLQAQVAFQRFVAYGNVAHARIDPPMEEWERFRAAGGRVFPLFLRVDGDVVRVIDGSEGLDGLAPGDRVVSVDGEPALAWLARMRAHLSADNDYMAWAQLERQLPLLAWLELGEVERFRVGFAKPDGRAFELDVPARARGTPVAANAVPPRFELDWNMREARMLDGDTAYLRPGPFYDNRPDAAHPWDPTAFRQFLDDAFTGFIANGAKRLLLDLRDNPGGDNAFSDPMIAWFADRPFRFSNDFRIRVSDATIASNRRRLDRQAGGEDGTSRQLAAAYAGQAPGSLVPFPVAMVEPRPGTRFEGDVYALVNRHSYSNAVLVAAIMQDYGFGKVVGEETSDLASTYGAMEDFTLPHSGLRIGYPKARILRPDGDPRPRGVVPDIAIRTPVASTTDEVLQQALDAIRRSP